MASINEKRAYVASISSTKSWKRRVKHMSDIQVTAIYLKEQAKGSKPKPKKETEDEDDIPF